jgi:hypothetical protein
MTRLGPIPPEEHRKHFKADVVIVGVSYRYSDGHSEYPVGIKFVNGQVVRKNIATKRIGDWDFEGILPLNANIDEVCMYFCRPLNRFEAAQLIKLICDWLNDRIIFPQFRGIPLLVLVILGVGGLHLNSLFHAFKDIKKQRVSIKLSLGIEILCHPEFSPHSLHVFLANSFGTLKTLIFGNNEYLTCDSSEWQSMDKYIEHMTEIPALVGTDMDVFLHVLPQLFKSDVSVGDRVKIKSPLLTGDYSFRLIETLSMCEMKKIKGLVLMNSADFYFQDSVPTKSEELKIQQQISILDKIPLYQPTCRIKELDLRWMHFNEYDIKMLGRILQSHVRLKHLDVSQAQLITPTGRLGGLEMLIPYVRGHPSMCYVDMGFPSSDELQKAHSDVDFVIMVNVHHHTRTLCALSSVFSIPRLMKPNSKLSLLNRNVLRRLGPMLTRMNPADEYYFGGEV